MTANKLECDSLNYVDSKQKDNDLKKRKEAINIFENVDLVLSCQLWTYLVDIYEKAQDRLQVIIKQMQNAESVTEKMKENDQWD